MGLKVIHGIGNTKAAATIIAVDHDRNVIWFTPDRTPGRLKAPLRMLPEAEPNMRIRFEQRGDTILKLTRVQ